MVVVVRCWSSKAVERPSMSEVVRVMTQICQVHTTVVLVKRHSSCICVLHDIYARNSLALAIMLVIACCVSVQTVQMSNSLRINIYIMLYMHVALDSYTHFACIAEFPVLLHIRYSRLILTILIKRHGYVFSTYLVLISR